MSLDHSVACFRAVRLTAVGVLVAVCGLLFVSAQASACPLPPPESFSETGPVIDLTSTSATVTGKVQTHPVLIERGFHVEYKAEGLESPVIHTPTQPLSLTGDEPAVQTLLDLTPDTVYDYRIVADLVASTTDEFCVPIPGSLPTEFHGFGQILQFKTPAAPVSDSTAVTADSTATDTTASTDSTSTSTDSATQDASSTTATTAVSDLAALPSSRSCASRRHFKIRLRERNGIKIDKAIVLVNGKKVKTVKSSRVSATIDLRSMPKGRFTVEITVFTKDGKALTGKRQYRTCAKKSSRKSTPKI